ncbi:hypothetical protein [Polyangium jinanense]|uniref:Tetratricopeptide repeat protein n=1 Tax=Polyangium jinanense TaxID=2829994 RepID=A0A9X3XA82_9BACT|nr:hypothetical protein [Polyangium jinanense]MDC3961426.1 hypothetical protein [Polyangium jinanense]MDC3987027.1 hypothetical protein [Polyangium jinanense]
MQSADENHPLCWFCKKQPATVRYVHPQFNEMVCATCLDRLEVQDTYEQKWAHHILELERQERYDEMLACIDEFLAANRHRDHDKWLARSVARDRTMVLFEAGRYAEAEKAWEAWAQLGFPNVTDRWFNGSVKASILQAFGRHRDALAAFEEAFSHQDPMYASAIPYYLPTLVKFSENAGQPVDEKWRRVAEAGAEDFAVEMPVRDSLGESMRALAEMTQGMPSKAEREWRATHGAGSGGNAP